VLLNLAARGIVSIQCLHSRYLITKRVERLPLDLPLAEAAAFFVMFLQPDRFLIRQIPKDISCESDWGCNLELAHL